MDNRCIFYLGDNRQKQCRALTTLACDYYICPFYKTREKEKEEKKITRRRLYGLPKGDREYIIEKYYNGDSKKL